MIIEYPNGDIFIKEHSTYLLENKYMSGWFFLDAPFIKQSDKESYILGAFSNDKKLLGIKLKPFNLVLYGDKECLKELLEYIKSHDLDFSGVMCPNDIGDYLIDLAPSIFEKDFYLSIGMDFMEAHEITEETSKEVSVPSLSDAIEIHECVINFFKDCGLNDEVSIDRIRNDISSYRIIRKDNLIVSLAKKAPDTDTSLKVSDVYTRPNYRGQGYARKIVNAIKNEIINSNKIATLNVDQANPISNHLYSSLGFKKVFSHGIYLIKEG